MKYKVDDGFTSVAINGVTYKADESGLIDIPKEVIDSLDKSLVFPIKEHVEQVKPKAVQKKKA